MAVIAIFPSKNTEAIHGVFFFSIFVGVGYMNIPEILMSK